MEEINYNNTIPTLPNNNNNLNKKNHQVGEFPENIYSLDLSSCLEELHLSGCIQRLKSHGINTLSDLSNIVNKLAGIFHSKTGLSLMEMSQILKMFDLLSFGKSSFMSERDCEGESHLPTFMEAKEDCKKDKYWIQKRENKIKGAVLSDPDKYLRMMKTYTGITPKHQKSRFLVILRYIIAKAIPQNLLNNYTGLNTRREGDGVTNNNNTNTNTNTTQRHIDHQSETNTNPTTTITPSIINNLEQYHTPRSIVGKRQPTFADVMEYDLSLPWDRRLEKYVLLLKGYANSDHKPPDFLKNSFPVQFKVDLITYMENRERIPRDKIACLFQIKPATLEVWWRDREGLKEKLVRQQELEIQNREEETQVNIPILMKRNHQKPTAVFKMQVIEYAKTHTTSETAEFCQISKTSVTRWKREKKEIMKEWNDVNARQEEINRRMSCKGNIILCGGEAGSVKAEEEGTEDRGSWKLDSINACKGEEIGEGVGDGVDTPDVPHTPDTPHTPDITPHSPAPDIPRSHDLIFIPHHCLKNEPPEPEHSDSTSTPNKSLPAATVDSQIIKEETSTSNTTTNTTTNTNRTKSNKLPKDQIPPNSGKGLTVEKRWLIIFIKKYLESEYDFTFREIAFVMNTSLATVMSYWNFYEKYGTVDVSKIPKNYKWTPDSKMCSAIEQFLDEKNSRGDMPIARDILFHLKELGFPPITHQALRHRYLKRIGYTWKRVQSTIANKENRDNQSMRGDYLRELMNNRRNIENSLEEVFLDESYVKDIHHRSNCWVKKNEINAVTMPKSNHQMVCIVAAINYLGWTGVKYSEIKDKLRMSCKHGVYSYGSIKYFKYENREESDYHHSFTIPFFSDYFKNNLLPGLTTPSILIMDRVSYHTHLIRGAVEIRKATRHELLESLLEKGIIVDKSDKIEDLRKRLLQEGNKTSFCEMKAQELGHKVLYLPPYHPEFNPIEQAWAFIKRRVGSNPKYNIQYICEQQLPQAFTEFTASRAYNLIRHTDGILQATLQHPQLNLPKKTVKYSRKEDSTFIERLSPDCLIWGTYKD